MLPPVVVGLVPLFFVSVCAGWLECELPPNNDMASAWFFIVTVNTKPIMTIARSLMPIVMWFIVSLLSAALLEW